MLKKINIKIAKKEKLKKINQFHNFYYKTNRTINQLLWQFNMSQKNKEIKNYFYCSKGKKVEGLLGFVKYEFISDKKKITAYKPEDLLMSVEAIKNRLFEKIYYKFENSKKKNFPLFFHFSDSAWAFKKLNYKINFGKYCYYIKFYELNEIYKILIKNGLPKLFAKIISNILNIILKLFFIKKMKKKNRKLKFVNYLKPPNWSNFLIKDFVKYWKCITLHRSYDFLNWRVFNNPYTDNKFVAFYYKKKPIGYIIYNIKNSNLTVIDLIFIPSEKKISPELIMDEVLDYLDDLSLKKKIKICKFELYLNSKINLKISDNLSKKGYFKKNKYSDFSYKCIKNKINIKEINNAYITNINKTGR